MKLKILLLLSVLLVPLGVIMAQNGSQSSERVVTFKFVPGKDMFYIPWGGNNTELNRLYSLIDEYHSDIASGKMPVYVDGYCASLPTARENLNTAFVRANRVKSDIITHKGLIEENFITKNYATTYKGNKDMVVVTLRILVKAEEPKPKPKPTKDEPKQEVKSQPQPEPVVVPEPEPEPSTVIIKPIKVLKPYCLSLRTNLLYDAFLLPTLGVEWRINRSWGVKLDGSRSWWGDEHGKVQKIWLVNPEVRWYMGGNKRFYMGASANFGEYNIYKGMIGNIASDDTGYQGKLWNAGLTAGYQLYLSRNFSLDFNLGLGYTNLKYDSFNLINEVRVHKAKDKTKDFFGPTQAGISLIWTFGGNK